MILDIFKNEEMFLYLEQFNGRLINIHKKFKYAKDDEGYSPVDGVNSKWFNPDRFRENFLTTSYPDSSPLTFESRFNLFLYAPNFVTLFLIDRLYDTNRDILIEDFACGAGSLFYYLSKLGFSNFHAVDNFSQVAYDLFKDVMDATLAVYDKSNKYKLNELRCDPKVVNIVGWTTYGRDVSPETELFCMYPNIGLVSQLRHKFIQEKFDLLCIDKDCLMLIYCRRDKYDEFIEKIKPFF
jgi:hypothetical protein